MRKILLFTFLSGFLFSALGQTNTNLPANAGNVGASNTSIGYAAGNKVTGSYNSMMGATAGANITSGEFNTMVGYRSGYYFNNGLGNVLFRSRSAEFNQAGNNNVIGRQAGRNGNGSQNIFIGYRAGYNEAGSNKLYIENSESRTPLIYGDFRTDNIRINGKFEVLTTAGASRAP